VIENSLWGYAGWVITHFCTIAELECSPERDMLIGERLRQLREDKNLSQGHIEKRTGLQRAYISRLENGHTIPSIKSLEKFARALEVPMYRFFFDGDTIPAGMHIPKEKTEEELWGSSGTDAVTLRKFRKLLEKISVRDRRILLKTAQLFLGD
jgi:transcriptional regulator with XRE-family HTH domain